MKLTLTVTGMSCSHCVTAVTDALAAVDGTTVDAVDIGSATVTYDPDKTTVGTLIDAVYEAGYEADEATV